MIPASPTPGGFPSKSNVHLTKTFSHCEGDFVCVNGRGKEHRNVILFAFI